MIINQEYKQWKKEAPCKYDLAILRSLEWPSITFQWLPDVRSDEDCDYHSAVICSNSLEPDQCELQTVRVAIPKMGKSIICLNLRLSLSEQQRFQNINSKSKESRKRNQSCKTLLVQPINHRINSREQWDCADLHQRGAKWSYFQANLSHSGWIRVKLEPQVLFSLSIGS